MANIWVYALGTERAGGNGEPSPDTLALRVIRELQASLRDEADVSEWSPFVSEHKHRGEDNYSVMLVPPSDCFGMRDYFIAANALALADSGRIRVLPVVLETNAQQEAAAAGTAAEVGESSLQHRNHRLRDSLMRTAVCVLKQGQEATLLGELMTRLEPEMADWPKRKPKTAGRTVSLFFSYSHADSMFRDELARHLKLLGRTGLFESWYDQQILPGDNWASEIDRHLCTSDIILLLLSADFFASRYCSEIEMPFARERHIAESARVIPVLLRPVAWSGSWLYDLQGLPMGALPVSAWPSTDSAFVSVCEGILGAALAAKADAARHERKAMPEFSTRRREVDTAMPGEVQVDRSAMLIVLIRKTSSEGLRGLLAEDASYGVAPEDVHSRTASVKFPRRGTGELLGVDLVALVRSPEFDPPEQTRQIHLAPDTDSQPVIFMVAAKSPGRLRAVVEIYERDLLLVSCPMSTLAVTGEVSGTATSMGSRAIAVEEAILAVNSRHIDFRRELPSSPYPRFPEGTSSLAVREFVLRQELAGNQRTMLPGDFQLAKSMNSLGIFLMETGRVEEAEALHRKALAIQENSEDPYTIGIFVGHLADVLRETNQLNELELLLRHWVELEEKRWGPEHWRIEYAVHQLAQLLLEIGKEEEGERVLRRTIAINAQWGRTGARGS